MMVTSSRFELAYILPHMWPWLLQTVKVSQKSLPQRGACKSRELSMRSWVGTKIEEGDRVTSEDTRMRFSDLLLLAHGRIQVIKNRENRTWYVGIHFFVSVSLKWFKNKKLIRRQNRARNLFKVEQKKGFLWPSTVCRHYLFIFS